MTAYEAIEMYNFIRETEDNIASGMFIPNIDMEQMQKTKEIAKRIIENELHIRMSD